MSDCSAQQKPQYICEREQIQNNPKIHCLDKRRSHKIEGVYLFRLL